MRWSGSSFVAFLERKWRAMLETISMRTLRVISGSSHAKSTAFYTLEVPLLRVELHAESVRESNVGIMSSRLFAF